MTDNQKRKMEEKREYRWDVIVVGGGHAGVEAALASARTGAKTLLLTHDIETIGQMSCNPAIGGLGKSHLVREIDALGGIMAKAADQAGIHIRVLNMRKGPAVRATRIQTDRNLYRKSIRAAVENQPRLCVMQQSVRDFLIKDNCIQGVLTELDLCCYAPCVVLTTGTFLRGMLHVGGLKRSGGRAGSRATNALAQRLEALKLPLGRLKTGTPPRIDGRSIDFSRLVVQPSEAHPRYLSFTSIPTAPPKLPCYLTNTNEATHRKIIAALDQSPLYNGSIQAIGPRYCPSIEDKVVRFPDKTTHRIFLEPEGLDTQEFYPNGISTSLPFTVQEAFVRTIQGLEQAHLTRPGYAIEYDFFDPRNLTRSLQVRDIEGLYFAGQINGTTGYEEAAAQGLIAGLNASRQAQGKSAWVPLREESYIGVLIDDLVTQGVTEPYRMFTSRVEYRLHLREDNADLRLTEKGRESGLIDAAHWQKFCQKKAAIAQTQAMLKTLQITPDAALQQNVNLAKTCSGEELLARTEYNFAAVMKLAGENHCIAPEVVEQVEIQAHYAGYMKRQQEEIKYLKAQEHKAIPENFVYARIAGLSNELLEKLNQVRPETIGQAGRIQGMTPAGLMQILVYLKAESPAQKPPQKLHRQKTA